MSGRVALVTGASSGIGAGIAEAFAHEGAAVFASGLEPDLTAATVDRLRRAGAGADADGIHADLTETEAATRLAAACVERFGRIDTLVNAAGDPAAARGNDGPLDATDPGYWDALYRSTLRSAMAVTRAALPHLRASTRGGRIIMIGSVMAERGGAWDVYATMKAGLVGLTRSLAVSVASSDVTANCIATGAVVVEKTATAWEAEPRRAHWRQHGLTRVGVPSDIAACCVWLGSDEGAFVTGAVVPVDGGMAVRGGPPPPPPLLG
jgi:NAD(P)-dependent dehydrogenase (short-subunit alcohol dehydrogenase family)